MRLTISTITTLDTQSFPILIMKFTAAIAAILSMAVVTFAAPVAVAEAEGESEPELHPFLSFTNNNKAQNHGMCVTGSNGEVTQIEGC